MTDSTRAASARSALQDAPPARVRRIGALLATHGDPLSVQLRPARLEELAKRLAGVVASAFDEARDDARALALLCAAIPRTLQLLDPCKMTAMNNCKKIKLTIKVKLEKKA